MKSFNLQQARYKLEQKKGRRDQIQADIKRTREKVRSIKKSLKEHTEARETLNEFMRVLQEKLQTNVSQLSSFALETVFDDPYQLIIEFIRKRNKMECDLYFKDQKGNRIDPDHSGGGARDIAATSLRIASWSMEQGHTQNTLILDEPFKHLKGYEANLRALEMLKSLAQKEGVQIIMVSDERIDRQETERIADSLFEIVNEDGQSKIIKQK